MTALEHASEHQARRASVALRSVGELLERLRLAIDTNREEAGRLLEAMARKIEDAHRRGRNAMTYPYKGQALTISQLAKLAGVDRPVMRERLRHHSPEEAVAHGAARMPKEARIFFELDGQKLTIAQLAERSGVCYATMWQRLHVRGLTPAEALNPKRKPRRKPLPKASPEPSPAPPPTPSPKPSPKLEQPQQRRSFGTTGRADPDLRPAAGAEVIVPADVKITVAKTPPGPYEVRSAPSVFGRIGTYPEPPRSAAARALKG